ncbi:hypothetical protein [Candidatus Venteria ishoeyi]|uniref:Pili assembly chaperone N-terminal domain-containing protein n=1 Tax=Candidatus Venteria ishoeyi TaxID=1899563 RepID=A0A1H6FH69_9GAMM|nr:hypothetical protein [Candidatus Venteria ishoeyi]MDM8547920.1 hypothetical protein [Candidatus Venteria ishoeyi]SEH08781.1 Uncharacterised protein [Candidatus Venteria ishoeyi]
MKRYFIVLLYLFLVIYSTPSLANLTVSKAIINFSDNSPPRQDLEVKNNDTNTLYVTVKAFQVQSPESDQAKEIELNNPIDAGLLVSPARLVIPPGQSKLVRVIVRKKATKKDLIYRVAITPTIGKIKSEEQFALKVMIAYKVLVIVQPPAAQADLQVKRVGETLVFTNHGNTNVLIRKIKQCNERKTDCVELNGNRLYSGEQWIVNLPYKGMPVETYQTVGSEHFSREY